MIEICIWLSIRAKTKHNFKMVEASVKTDATAEQMREAPAQTTQDASTEEAKKEELQAAFTEFDFSKANQPLDADESEKLAAFLTKVQTACKNDSSLPGFIGEQVNTWMQELDQG